ncbi:unnamed protein product [Diplocarpon coronariae]
MPASLQDRRDPTHPAPAGKPYAQRRGACGGSSSAPVLARTGVESGRICRLQMLVAVPSLGCEPGLDDPASREGADVRGRDLESRRHDSWLLGMELRAAAWAAEVDTKSRGGCGAIDVGTLSFGENKLVTVLARMQATPPALRRPPSPSNALAHLDQPAPQPLSFRGTRSRRRARRCRALSSPLHSRWMSICILGCWAFHALAR